MKKQLNANLPFEVWYKNGVIACLPSLISFMEEVLTSGEESPFYVKVFDVENYPDDISSRYNCFYWVQFFKNVEKCECIYFNNSVEYGSEPLWVDKGVKLK